MPEDLEPNDEQQTETDSPIISNLRKDREDAIAEAAAAKRELTLHKAGLGGLDEMQMAALEGAHKKVGGEWEAEALKATATKLGFVQTGAEPPEPGMDPTERAAMQRVQSASASEPPASPDLDAALKGAKTREELHEIMANAGMLLEE